jgi:hypothetical protein
MLSNWLNNTPVACAATIDVSSPLDKSIIAKCPLSTPQDIHETVTQSHQAFELWRFFLFPILK